MYIIIVVTESNLFLFISICNQRQFKLSWRNSLKIEIKKKSYQPNNYRVVIKWIFPSCCNILNYDQTATDAHVWNRLQVNKKKNYIFTISDHTHDGH